MSTNISKLKRERLLSGLAELRDFVASSPPSELTGRLLGCLAEVERDISGRKYGVFFEEHRENIDELLSRSVPLLCEETELALGSSGPLNFLIEGDNLAALQLLLKTHRGSIGLIYIDPPYNTNNNDFIYDDSFVGAEDLFRHSKWMSFMDKRLRLARKLLRPDGSIFISIDNNEFAQLKLLADRIFGEGSFVTALHVEMSITQGMKVRAAKQGNIVKNGEYILVYRLDGSKNIGHVPLTDPVRYDPHYCSFLLGDESPFTEVPLSAALEGEGEILGALRLLGLLDRRGSLPNKNLPAAYDKCDAFRSWVNANAGRICRMHDAVSVSDEVSGNMVPGLVYSYSSDSRSYLLSKNESGGVYQRIPLSDKLSVADDYYGTYGPTKIRGDWWSGFYLDMGNIGKEGGVDFLNGKKPKRLIKQIIKFALQREDDTVLDFFAGSGTTGQAVMELNAEDGGRRRFILCTSNENGICRTVTWPRLRNVIEGEGRRARLKCFRVDYLPTAGRLYYEYAGELLKHMRELVELETGADCPGGEAAIVLDESQLCELLASPRLARCRRLYMHSDILLGAAEAQRLSDSGVTLCPIPEYYYDETEG